MNDNTQAGPRRPTKGRGIKTRNSKVRCVAHLTPAVHETLLRAAARNHRSLDGEVVYAIEEHLRAAGLLKEG